METQYLTEKQTAALTTKSRNTLRNDRHNRRGLPYIKDGRRVIYDLRDILQHLDARKVVFDQSPDSRVQPGWAMVIDEQGKRYLCPERAATQK